MALSPLSMASCKAFSNLLICSFSSLYLLSFSFCFSSSFCASSNFRRAVVSSFSAWCIAFAYSFSAFMRSLSISFSSLSCSFFVSYTNRNPNKFLLNLPIKLHNLPLISCRILPVIHLFPNSNPQLLSMMF